MAKVTDLPSGEIVDASIEGECAAPNEVETTRLDKRDGEQSANGRKRGVDGDSFEAMDVEESALNLHPFLKRMKLNAEPEVEMCTENANPDSVSHFLNEIRECLVFVLSKPKLLDGSSSFVRDYLRTLLMKESVTVERNLANPQRKSSGTTTINDLPVEIIDRIQGFMDAPDLARSLCVCKSWRNNCSQSKHWRRLCLTKWQSLDTDDALWHLLEKAWNLPAMKVTDDLRWIKIYPKLREGNQWRCGLKKTGRFVCNLIAHQVGGEDLGEDGLPHTLVVERRFNLRHLNQFVVANASILYFEPETERDRKGFESFIDYLVERTRAGLAVVDVRRFIFIPPCEYVRDLDYHGKSLLGAVQREVPPLQA